jgi:two-component system sensor histidine kinase RegB
LATVAAGAAHELSTPLATIAVAARELERAASGQPNAGDMVDDARLIRREIDRCRRVIDDMAGRVSEPMGEAPRLVQWAEVMADILEGIAPPQRARVRWLTGGVTDVTWPVGVVAQAVANLVRNALQASADDQAVTVDCQPAGETTVAIVVRDQGTGMEPDVLARVGEPFFTTKPQGLGIGLGVFTARSAIERLGGTVDLASVPGGGTTATITLPRHV